MFILRQRFNSWEQPACNFVTRQLPSNDLLPFFQSYLCSLENQCNPLDKYEEIQSWDKAPWVSLSLSSWQFEIIIIYIFFFFIQKNMQCDTFIKHNTNDSQRKRIIWWQDIFIFTYKKNELLNHNYTHLLFPLFHLKNETKQVFFLYLKWWISWCPWKIGSTR
jgi:hypothetical protein